MYQNLDPKPNWYYFCSICCTRTTIQVCNRYGSRTENVEFILVFVLFLRACIGYETNVSCIRIWIPNRKCWYCKRFRILLSIRTIMCCGYGSRIENVDFILVFVLFFAHGLGWWIGCETENVDFISVFSLFLRCMHRIWNRTCWFYIGFCVVFARGGAPWHVVAFRPV